MDLSDIESRLHTQRFDLEAAAAITILEQLANRGAAARGQGFERHYACVETALDIVRDAFALDRVPATLRARLIAQVEADHPVCRAPMARASMDSCRRMLASDLASTLAASAARCGDPLASTWRLIARAFPGGVPHDAIDALIALLYDHMSDRQLGAVVAALSGVDSEVATNRIYRVAATDAQPGRLDDVRRQLADAGLDDWMGE